eukprot:6545571-Prymnesium_polylepis.1
MRRMRSALLVHVLPEFARHGAHRAWLHAHSTQVQASCRPRFQNRADLVQIESCADLPTPPRGEPTPPPPLSAPAGTTHRDYARSS